MGVFGDRTLLSATAHLDPTRDPRTRDVHRPFTAIYRWARPLAGNRHGTGGSIDI